MRWQDVTLVHKALGGVYVKGGKLISLLASSDSRYGNEVSRDKVRYAINPKKTEFVKAFESALSEGHSFRVFYKETPGRWLDLGFFRVASEEKTDSAKNAFEMRYYILFSTKRAKGIPK